MKELFFNSWVSQVGTAVAAQLILHYLFGIGAKRTKQTKQLSKDNTVSGRKRKTSAKNIRE